LGSSGACSVIPVSVRAPLFIVLEEENYDTAKGEAGLEKSPMTAQDSQARVKQERRKQDTS